MIFESQLLPFKQEFLAFQERAETQLFACNTTITTDDYTVYLRKQLTGRGSFDYHLCIGAVEISSALRGKGVFKALILFLEQNIGHFGSIEFESVMSSKLLTMLAKHGYKPADYRGGSVCSQNLIKRIE